MTGIEASSSHFSKLTTPTLACRVDAQANTGYDLGQCAQAKEKTCLKRRGELPRGYSHKKEGGCLSYMSGVEKVVLVPPSVFSLKTSSAGAFAV